MILLISLTLHTILVSKFSEKLIKLTILKKKKIYNQSCKMTHVLEKLFNEVRIID